MCVTDSTQDFSPAHEKAVIRFGSNFAFADRTRKAWPSGPGFKLRFRAKQVVTATYALVDSILMIVT